MIREKLVTFDGFDIFYSQEGKGPAILFFHGFPDTHHLWEGAIKKLSEHFTCYAIDLPGLGQSKAASHFDFRLPSMSTFVAKLVEQLHIEAPFHLVVHDLGAFYGLSYASDYPENISALTIFNSDFHSDFSWYFWARVWRLPILGELAMYISSFSIFKHELQAGSKTLSDDYLRAVYHRIRFANRKMALRHFRGWNKEDLLIYEQRYTEQTKKIPKQVIWGEKDPYTPKQYASRFGTENILSFPDVGHWVMIEKSHEVNLALEKFALAANLELMEL